MLVCRYDKDANPNSCGGCQYGCIERKPATINEEFEKAIKDMMEDERWKNAVRNAKQTKIMYESIGIAGVFGVRIINSLIERYEKGERTEDLLEQLEDIE